MGRFSGRRTLGKAPRPVGVARRAFLVGAISLLLVATLAGEARRPAAAPAPRLRPILISGDPAGDDMTVCYAQPETHPNGYTDAPRAAPGVCVAEITDTLSIDFGQGASPTSMLITGPGISKVLKDPSSFYLGLGFPVGDYRFVAPIAGRVVRGSTMSPSPDTRPARR